MFALAIFPGVTVPALVVVFVRIILLQVVLEVQLFQHLKGELLPVFYLLGLVVAGAEDD